MSIHEHVEEFAGLPVRNYDPSGGLDDPEGTAIRLSIDYDSEGSFDELLAALLDDPASRRLAAVVVGSWTQDPPDGSTEVVEALASASGRLPGLRAIFLGDIIGEECEISWINQSDVGPLLAAYPTLEHFQVRGGGGLSLGDLRHEGLRSLVIEAGGLPGELVRQVAAADLPNLEHLELWLGDENYGGNTTVDDLAPILAGDRFPKLKYLGLRDSEIADAVAAALAEAPVLRKVEVLDLSLGNLGDDGALALLNGGNLAGLKKLDIRHHYVSDEVLDGLKALGIELDDGDRKEPDDWGGELHRYIAVSE